MARSHFVLAVVVAFTGSAIASVERPFILMTGGIGDHPPSVSTVSPPDDIKECQVFPDIPKHPYGGPDLVGAISATADNELFVCGGMDWSGPPFSTYNQCYKTDVLANNGWKESTKMPEVTAFAGAASDGALIAVVGGMKAHYDGPSPTQWIYSDKIRTYVPYLDQWGELEVKLPQPTSHTCAVFWDRWLLVTSREFTGYVDMSSNYPDEFTWKSLPNPGIFKPGCATIKNEDGSPMFVVVGGIKTYLIDVERGQMSALPDMPTYRDNSPSVVTQDGTKIVVAGGSDNSLDVEVFDRRHQNWTTHKSVMKQPRSDHSTATWLTYTQDSIKCRN